MKKKRFMMVVAGISILASLMLVACGGSGGGSDKVLDNLPKLDLDENTPGWKADNSPVTLDWYINFSWYTAEWGEDMVSQKITEDTGVNIDFVLPPGNEAQKLNTLIASGDLPDLITLGWWEGQVRSMIEQGYVYALDELAENYDPYFFKVASPTRVKWYTQDNGHFYAYPNASYTPEDYEKYDLPSNQTFLVRKDIYEAIGSPDMRTPEGFLNAMRKAKEMFPKVDNNQTLIPIGLHEFGSTGCYSLEAYLMNFLAIPMEKDGKFYDRYADPEYKRWLNVFREMNSEGLLSDDIYTDRRTQMEEKISQGRYFAMLYQHSDMSGPQMTRHGIDPDTIYIAVDGPANSKLDPPRLAGQGIAGWTVTLISKNCKRPDRAIRFLSYMISEEGQKLSYLGIEGETFNVVDGKPKFTKEVEEMLAGDRGAFNSKYGAASKYWMLMDSSMISQWETPPETPMKELINWTRGKTVSYATFDDIAPIKTDPESRIATKLGSIFGKALPELLVAETEEEFNQLWDEMQQKRVDAGLADLIAFQQKKVDRNKAKMGN